MKPSEILMAAYAMIKDRAHWTTGVLARDRQGAEVDPCSFRANCWCAEGAMYAAAGHSRFNELRRSFDAAFKLLEKAANVERVGWTASTFNDNRGHAEVLAMYCDAIASAKFMEATS